MNEKQNRINRRIFLKTVGAAGLGSVLTSGQANAKAVSREKHTIDKPLNLPKRKLGKTGVEVSSLCLGTLFDVMDSQITLRKALQLGVNYWDTAHAYIGGNSELGIGKFFSKNPDSRKKVFLATKPSIWKMPTTAEELERRLQLSLQRMNTTYIDLFYGVHILSKPKQLTNELRVWAEGAKKRKLIRFFGFSTHHNMAECLKAAAKVDWIDAILTSYNFRLMQDSEMQEAVEACHKANIGLTAMKVIGKTGWEIHRVAIETEEDRKLTQAFVEKGYTQEQANLKVVLEDSRISSACVTMENVALLKLNAAVALNKPKLS